MRSNSRLTKADRIIRILKLRPHPEGGHFREMFRDSGEGRAHSTAIYFLLRRGEASRWHRIDAAEVWHWYGGAPLELLIAKNRARPKRHILGGDVENGERPQIVVPAKHWQAARSLGTYTLHGCARIFVRDVRAGGVARLAVGRVADLSRTETAQR